MQARLSKIFTRKDEGQMTVTNRCDTIAKILHRRVELQAYKDRASHFALSKALLKQDASEVVSAYNNLFDLIRDFITTIHYSKKEIDSGKFETCRKYCQKVHRTRCVVYGFGARGVFRTY